jgi:hypothetical protein
MPTKHSSNKATRTHSLIESLVPKARPGFTNESRVNVFRTALSAAVFALFFRSPPLLCCDAQVWPPSDVIVRRVSVSSILLLRCPPLCDSAGPAHSKHQLIGSQSDTAAADTRQHHILYTLTTTRQLQMMPFEPCREASVRVGNAWQS